MKQRIEMRLKAHKTLYIPLFSYHHWIAGILSSDDSGATGGNLRLRIFDSAPSWAVHKDLCKRLHRVWPNLELEFCASQRQARDSDDCWIFMTANFFAHFMNITIVPAEDLPARLRTLLFAASQKKPKRAAFLRDIRSALLGLPTSATALTTPSTVEHKLQHAGKAAMPLIGGAVFAVEEVYNASEPHARTSGLGYMLTASVLASEADGQYRSLTLGALRERARRMDLRTDVLRTVARALEKMEHTALTFGVGEALAPPRILEEVDVRPRRHFFLSRVAANVPLPASIHEHVFTLGATHDPAVRSRTGQVGHYTVTREVAEASIGLYVLRDADHNALPPRASRPRPTATRQTDTHNEPAAEMQAAMETGLSGALNGRGRYPEGCACPRDWFIHPAKPPHTTQVAWTAMNPQVRVQHRQWLENLRAMPADLLTLPLHTAAIELIRCMGAARHWKWSTMARHYASVQAALLQLPLYTNQTVAIDLAKEPEWRQAISGARRFERETERDPPDPLTLEEYNEVHASLRDYPAAQALLVMMWACAARPGDVTQLLVKDIHFAEEIPPDSIRMQVTIRRGKGACFRGPYTIPTVLSGRDAILVRSVMAERPEAGRLFPDDIPLRTRVREAIKAVNSAAALPSLRKGATRRLAAQGLPEAMLMRITGHMRLQTLRQYLGFGQQATAEDVAVQYNVHAALSRQNNLAARPPQPAT